MNQVFFVLDVAPTEEQLAQCGPVRKAEAADRWLLTVKENGNADLVGPQSDRLTSAQAREIVSGSSQWNGAGPT